MARFRKISVRMWLGGSFTRLSPLAPSGQALWVYLLTNPDTVAIPGLYRAGEAGMAEALGWSIKAFRDAFAEVLAEGMAEADWKARVVWIPNAVEHDPPQSPNAVKSWGKWADEIPECPLKVKAHQRLKAFAEDMGDAFGLAFREVWPEPSRTQEQDSGVRIQEQERKRTSSTDDARKFINLWNENRGTLPAVRVVSEDRIAQAKRCLRASEDWEAWTPAVKAFAADDFNKERRYGMETLARHCGKWLSLGAEDPRAGDETWQKALRAQAQWEKDYGTA